jgi:hypothetical protein
MTQAQQVGTARLGGHEFKNTGRILIEQPNWTLAVKIGEIRNGHAAIELPFEFELTSEFSLIFDELHTLVECHLASQNGRLARVCFLTAPRSISLHRYRPLHEKSALQKSPELKETA